VEKAKKPMQWKKKLIFFFIVPSLIGMSVFYFIPAIVSVINAFTDHRGDFVGLGNFIEVLTSSAFRLASQNTLLFIIASVPLNMGIAFLLAGLCQNLRRKKIFAVALMLPLIIPSGAIVYFWQILFADNGVINRILFERGMDTTVWFATPWAFGIILAVFLFKNIGFNFALFLAGYQLIPKEYYEITKIEGASVFQTFRNVTFVYMLPTTLLVFIMSVINSFKIFREIYLLFGAYPHQSVYMLQHYMNNQFVAANMQRLSVTATLMTVIIFIVVLGIFKGTRKLTEIY
jgi:multiple sugar transport system permease protein